MADMPGSDAFSPAEIAKKVDGIGIAKANLPDKPCEGVLTMKTDSQLQGDVLAELKWLPSVNAAHIGVTAKEGVVTLTGQVTHYAEKAAAENAAKGVYGVKGMADDIVVEPPGSSKRTDQDIAEAALSALKWDFEIPNDKVKVLVKNG